MQQIKNILVSQPVPCDYSKSPYKALADKFNLNITFRKVIKIVGLSTTEFKKHNVNLLKHTAVIFNSRHAADNFFRIAKELGVEVPGDMKYFCISDTIAYYIQKYVQFRKRRCFFGDQTTEGFVDLLQKHKEENFLFPMSEESMSDLLVALENSDIIFTKAPMYRTVPDNIAKEIDIEKYDMIALFSPVGVQSIMLNFPEYKQKKHLIAAFGKTVWNAVEENGFKLSLPVPTPTAVSMTQAIEEFLIDYKQFNGNMEKIEEKRKIAEEKVRLRKTEMANNTKSIVSKGDYTLKYKSDKIAALKIIEERKKKRICFR
ncbi:MAG: uroporphyrinogen-III synthase [Bacteroidales bacterium]|jgi:uroporphyrinogen-III synthase|nr:uroporphyrinogen-III synthase [Bacteroidales bacterium]